MVARLGEGTTDEAESQLWAWNGRIKGFDFSIGNGEQFLSQGRSTCPACPLRKENWVRPAVWILKRGTEHELGPKCCTKRS